MPCRTCEVGARVEEVVVHVHKHEYPPDVVGAKEAAYLLGMKETAFRETVKLYPDKLRAFNLSPNGRAVWSREDILSFREWRKSIGLERAG